MSEQQLGTRTKFKLKHIFLINQDFKVFCKNHLWIVDTPNKLKKSLCITTFTLSSIVKFNKKYINFIEVLKVNRMGRTVSSHR